MGCEDLFDITEPEQIRFSDFSAKTIAIDAVFWFNRYYHAVVKEEFSLEEMTVGRKYHIIQPLCLLVSIPDLLRNNITPVFFFDPKNREDNADVEIPYLEHTPTSNPTEQLHSLQRPTELVLNYLDILYYKAPRDAEADASVYATSGEADMVVSNDYDTLLYQAPVTARKRSSPSGWQKIGLNQVLDRNGITHEELLTIAILCGTDENIGPYKNHIDEAVEKVKQSDSLENLQQAENTALRAPSGKMSHRAPTFSELCDLFQNPIVSHSLWRDIQRDVDPSISDPDLGNLETCLTKMLQLEHKTAAELIHSIKQEL